MLVIGLMSGTSADGVDAALVRWPDDEDVTPFELVAYEETPFAPELRERIHRLADGKLPAADALAELAGLDVELAMHFADAALRVADKAGIATTRIDAIASHGQTVAHHPELHASLQIGNPSVIAENAGITTVANFRARDLALGGEGAPLAPFFHHAVLASADENRVALNLGGIANLTWLPRSLDPDAVVAFDTGPANSLVDGVLTASTQGRERMDRDGARARRGQVDEAWLARLLEDEYLERPPPKSTGRERYGDARASALLEESKREGVALDDLVATLVAYTAQSVAAAVLGLLPSLDPQAADLDSVLVGGGGAFNPAMLDALRDALPGIAVGTFADAGVPIDAAEAMAFSLLGRNTLLGIPNHLPRCTGARRAGVLGEVVAR